MHRDSRSERDCELHRDVTIYAKGGWPFPDGCWPKFFPPLGKECSLLQAATHKLLFTYVRPLRGTRPRGSCSEGECIRFPRKRTSPKLRRFNGPRLRYVYRRYSPRARNFFFTVIYLALSRPARTLKTRPIWKAKWVTSTAERAERPFSASSIYSPILRNIITT